MKKQKLIIVGLGMAASRLLDELVKAKAQDRFEIVVFGDENVGGYNRILLSHVLSGEQSIAGIVSHDQTWFDQQNITWFSGRKVVKIDIDAKYVIDARGECHDYDLLVIATGSLPLRAEVKGNQLNGVMSFRDVWDVQKLLALQADGGRVVVVGAGLLGLEAAYGLIKQGLPVTVVHRSDRIMSQQLDHAAASLLQAQLESLGIAFELSTQISEIVGNDQVKAVRLTQGDTVACQAVVMAMGIRPNIGLADASGLRVNKGVVINAQCQTPHDSIYAIGECNEFDGHTYGLVAPIFRQVSVLVDQLCGDGRARFRHEETPTLLKVSGVSLSSFGSSLTQENQQALLYQDTEQKVYRKVLLDSEDRIVSAVLLGNTQGSQTLFQRYQTGAPLSMAERATAVFGQLTTVSEGV